MGQKVNPHGIRVGVIKDWDSRWFASKKDFSDNLVEDHKIRTELKAQLKDAGVPKIEIERTVDPSTSAPRVTVNIYCAKPGMVIGKGGEERVALQNKLTKEYGKTVIVNVIEVKSAATNAQLVRSAGNTAQLMAKENGYALVRLPSGEMRNVPVNCTAVIGQVSNIDHENVNLGKAGRKRHMGVRPGSRGTVMNPCDHPHGGGEGRAPVGHSGPMTPWGKPALGLKTRKHHKRSDKLIVKRAGK